MQQNKALQIYLTNLINLYQKKEVISSHRFEEQDDFFRLHFSNAWANRIKSSTF